MVTVYVSENKITGLHTSPFAWRALMALKHKGIEFERVGVALAEVAPLVKKLTNGEWDLIPTVVYDDSSYSYDSLQIAKDLDRRYPDAPPLFPNGYEFAEKIEEHQMTGEFISVLKCHLPQIFATFSPTDNIHQREKRFKQFGCTIEEFCGKWEDSIDAADKAFDYFRDILKKQKFLEGDQSVPKDFDYLIGNHKDQIINNWYRTILNMYGGYAKNAPTVRPHPIQ